jgi:hypothetical protein
VGQATHDVVHLTLFMCFFSRIAPALFYLSLLCLDSRAQTPSADFFLSTLGNDAWSGKLPAPNAGRTDGPFASVARAQVALRELRKSDPNRPRTIMLREGTYYLPLAPTAPGTLRFSALDSATSANPTTWQNYPGEMPVISGGEAIGKGGLRLTWKHLSGSLWQVPLPANTQPFEYLYYNGQRRLRSRLQSSSGVGYLMHDGSCYSTVTKRTVDTALCNLGTFLRIAAEVPAKAANAGCPAVARNDHPSTAKCLDRFIYNANDPIANWVNLNPNDTACPPGTGHAKDFPAGDVELTLFNASTVDVMRVSCVDSASHTIYLSAPTKGDSVNYDSFGPVAGHRYIIENAKDAFDAAAAAGQTGLWFLDRSTSPWTLNYLANRGENPNNDSAVIAQVQPVGPIGGSLISAVYLDCVTFRGLTFEVDNFVPSPMGFNNDEISEDTLPEAIDCISCNEITFDGITVRHTSASGIMIASGSGDIDRPPINNKIINSAFYDIGASGIRIGRHPLGSDRPNHVIQFATIENNVVQGYGRVFAAGIGMSQSDGHDITYLHNDITDGYHAGLTVCLLGCPAHTANGFNISAQYNHIWNVMQGITSDGGALYFSVGAPDGTGSNNRIANNLIYDVTDSSVIDPGVLGYGYGGHGIFLDHKSAAVDVENNVVFQVTDSGLAMNAGPPKGYPGNSIRNNIFTAARKSSFKFPEPWSPEGCGEKQLRVTVVSNIFQFDNSAGFHVIQGCTYSCGLDHDKFENFQGNLYWRTDGKFSSEPKAFPVTTKASANPARCQSDDSTFVTFRQWQDMREDVAGTASVDPGFGKTHQPKDYLLTRSPVAGFDFNKTNDTIQKAGRSHPAIMPPPVPATFPTYSLRDF